MTHDVVISGAGSAGLSTAIFCARAGLDVLVLEKYSKTGVFPRGETMRPDPIITELLGPDFMDQISFNRTALRRYYSPGCREFFSLERDHASYIFHWKDLTEGLKKIAEQEGVTVLMNHEVIAPVERNGNAVAVITGDGKIRRGTTIVAADGHNSILGRKSGLNYRRINSPIAKRICSGIESDFSGMEFFIITPGTLPELKSHPPMIAFIFPRGDGDAEAGVMVITGAMPPGKRGDAPSGAELLKILKILWETYPVFSDRLKKADVSFEGASIIPMAGMHHEASAIPGLILTGDTIGLVEASGGCGIVACMKNGKFLSRFLVDNGVDNGVNEWNNRLMKQYNREFKKSDIYRHISGKYSKLLPVMRLLLNRKWRHTSFDRLWRVMGQFNRKV
ncbi:MAG: NAD(P)/FAD-dependent oxidoreductase [Desulfobacteraceae bacterium]|nr:NAD(P)/FAD-dependent oxidoreductase [Desulfobacteraceae bacterium]MBC2757607.1 NAD(P)/FAD-dependent oxidoreductase [Desulfobacteraceae bacterium]